MYDNIQGFNEFRGWAGLYSPYWKHTVTKAHGFSVDLKL